KLREDAKIPACEESLSQTPPRVTGTSPAQDQDHPSEEQEGQGSCREPGVNPCLSRLGRLLQQKMLLACRAPSLRTRVQKEGLSPRRAQKPRSLKLYLEILKVPSLAELHSRL
ncbi:TDRD12 isoform 4, partial [Pan troglodytes]